jgi:endonuclease III
MKNATKHSEQLRSMYRRLVREHKPAERQPMDPLTALVRSALSFDVEDARADDAMAVVGREFCDLNELRVATELEVREMIGPRYPQIERRASLISHALNSIFDREHTLSLDRLKTSASKRDVRQFLRDMPDSHPFVEAFVMLYGFDGPAVPLDDTMLQYLRDEGVLEAETTLDEAQRFVEHHLKAEEYHPFFVALRAKALDSSKGRKSKAKA